MSYLKISVICPQTAHRFCYCFAPLLPIKCWPPPLAALKKTYIQLASWFKPNNINSSCAPGLWLLIFWWNSWDLSNLTLWFWTGSEESLPPLFPISPAILHRHPQTWVMYCSPGAGGSWRRLKTRKGAKNMISYGLTWDWINFLEHLNMFYKILFHKEMICRKEPRSLSVLGH